MTNIPHSLESVIGAVQALIDGRPIPQDWTPQPQTPDLFDVLNQGGLMDRATFDALTADEKTQALADGLANLRTQIPEGPNLSPLEQQISNIAATIANLAEDTAKNTMRLTALETAILMSGERK